MSLPKISLHDGKHKMIVAEEGERVLTPEQNAEYERTHPGARKEPMQADVYEDGGVVSMTENLPLRKESSATADYAKAENAGAGTSRMKAVNALEHINFGGGGSYQPDQSPVMTTPLMNQMYDAGGVVYDEGGLVGKIANRAKEIYSDMKKYPATVQEPMSGIAATGKNVEEYNAAQRPAMKQPFEPTTMGPPTNPKARYGDRPGEQRIPDAELKEMTKPLYDDGGVVETEEAPGQKELDREQIKDREAQTAAMRQAETEVNAEERGRTPDQVNVSFGGEKAIPNPKGIKPQMDTDAPEPHPDKPVGTKMSTDNAPLGPPKMNIDNAPLPGEGGITEPVPASIKAPRPSKMNYTPATPEPAAEQAPDPMDIVRQDKMEAMKKGTAGLSDLGTSLIHENLLMPKYTGKGANEVAQGEMIVPGDKKAYPALLHAEFEDKRKDYDRRIQAAMDQGTPEGDREAESLQLAKMHFEKTNHLGTPGNKPGLLGKIEHGLGVAGNIAGNIAAPGTMALIPGTELYKQRQEQKLHGQEEAATKESLEQAQARVAGAKTVPEQVFRKLMTSGPNGGPEINPDTNAPYKPEEAQVASSGVGKSPVQVLANGLMHEVNPETGKNYTQVEALDEAMKRQAGNKLNEQQRRIADYLAANKMEDTPQNRDTARVAIEKRDALVKQQVALPFSEAKAKFNDTLSTSRALLVQQNADANQRGLKADELQQVENARSSAVSSKLQNAKDALAATDEQFSNQIVPIVALLAETGAQGIKRVNKQELDKFVPASGSFGRWIEGHGDQFLSGQIPEDYRAEVGHMLDRMTAAETAEHIINTRSIDDTIRQGAQTPVQKPGGGAKATPTPSKKQAPAATPTNPVDDAVAKWKKNKK